MKLEVSQRFYSELRWQCTFLRERNPDAARKLRDRVLRSLARLEQFPDSGRSWRTAGTRELVIPGLPYIAIYRIQDNTVVVLSLLHTARQVPHVQ